MNRTKIALISVLVVSLMGGLGGVGWHFYNQYQHSQKLLKDPAAAAQEEIKFLVERLTKHMILNTDETPIIAKVTDAEQLAQNPFFSQAKTGDVMVIFQQSNKAVLFRPDDDRIVNIVSPISTQPEVAGTQSAQVATQLGEASLTILNSTNTAGLASVAERNVLAKSDAYKIENKANAKTDDYAKTLVVILNPEAKNLGVGLAETVNAEITENLPDGEEKPDTDLLLILGTDYKP